MTDYDIQEDAWRHQVLYAALRWFDHRRQDGANGFFPPDLFTVNELRDRDPILRQQKKDRLHQAVYQLEDLGLMDKVSFHGKTVGYTLSGEGADELLELGKPSHYDHD
jgi:hypothetical protein